MILIEEQTAASGLTKEKATIAIDAAASELKGYIPKTRFDEVNRARKQAEAKLKERDAQLRALKGTCEYVQIIMLQTEQLTQELAAAIKQYEIEAGRLRLDAALRLALSGRIHDPDMEIRLLDKGRIGQDDDGTRTISVGSDKPTDGSGAITTASRKASAAVCKTRDAD